MNKKFAALLLALVMMLGCFTACGGSDAATETTPAPIPTPEAETTPSPETESEEENSKYQLAFEKYPADATVMTVNGLDVRWDEYYYWVSNMAQQVESAYSVTDWSANIDSTYTYQSFIQAYAEDVLSQYWVVQDTANDLGVTLTEEDESYIEQVYQSDITTYGGGDEAAFEEYLSKTFISPGLYRKMLEMSQLYAGLFTYHFGENGSSLSDEDAMSYAENAGYLHAKHILFMTLDAEGNAMSDEDKAQRLTVAQEVYDELSAITDEAELLSRFDDLMYEYSDDTGLMTAPNGYYFLPGEMVTEFENGTTALEENAMSEIIESPYGYHIILRLPLELDAPTDISYGYTLRYLAASALYQNLAAEWFNADEIVYADEFAALDFNELFAAQE